MDGQAPNIGRGVLPSSFRECYREYSVPDFNAGSCLLFGGSFIPPGADASCRACPGWQYVKEAYAQHKAAGREPIDIRGFRKLYVVNNDFVARWLVSQWAEVML